MVTDAQMGRPSAFRKPSGRDQRSFSPALDHSRRNLDGNEAMPMKRRERWSAPQGDAPRARWRLTTLIAACTVFASSVIVVGATPSSADSGTVPPYLRTLG